MTRGFLILDKPSGMSSNEVVSRVKRATAMKKVGHAGTLDPMATGALVIGVGKVTRLIRFIQDQPKEDLATALFGVATDTLDADGSILDRAPMEFDRAGLEAIVPRFVGRINQVPPMVSALKRDGRRLYDLARAGVEVERDARPVVVHELEVLSVGSPPYPEVDFRVVCGKGTYVRSLADDMASALGGSAHLTSLRRTRIGSLRVEDGLGVDDLDRWRDFLLSPAQALTDMEMVEVGEETARAVRHGMRFVAGEVLKGPETAPFGVTDTGGRLLAVYKRSGDTASPEVVLPE
jgi:tRNA pseudouridine55 synthase